ncbi:MAG: DUF3427 domain-containing protein [Negativicutes bacterium]|nr:DUF3427 domain-containing protein [Negativicutes bacterium]
MDVAELRKGLETGFVNLQYMADDRYVPKILTNNRTKQTKVLDTVLYELERCDEFFFSVAFITNSGVACLIDVLKKLESKNIKGSIIASQYQNFTEPRALERLMALTNIQVKIVTDQNFHAKGYLFCQKDKDNQGNDEYTMIVGSSNLTQTALSENQEWNVKLKSGKDGYLLLQMLSEFNETFLNATVVNKEWIETYEKIYKNYQFSWNKVKTGVEPFEKINPNKMQIEALAGIEALRLQGKDKGLLISATGTGKTYLSAFDVKRMQPKSFLFVVHREIIADEAKKSFRKVLGPNVKMGMYTGGNKTDAPYLFATVQTLSKEDNLRCFEKSEFDYIVIDEAHRSGAATYKRILDHFEPKFLLGMTATPERTDGDDIFTLFDHNIAYEIRLHQALNEKMLVPFHYHGIRDIVTDDEKVHDGSDFKLLTSEARVKHILSKANLYGCDSGRVKGLVFCSLNAEASFLSDAFNKAGYNTVALSGESSDDERKDCIDRLESDEIPRAHQLDYIFTRDIFNEGVDIPKVNQIIMLRPTQSTIVFVQQLGRGLRKANSKRYLEVIDFIGNYQNNFLVPIALYGDRSFNKDKIRRCLATNYIPGASTIHFDDIVKEQIYKAIDGNNLSLMKDLLNDYKLMKYQLGRRPMMMDFVKFGGRDPYTFLAAKDSFYEFACKAENENIILPHDFIKSLAFIGKEVANGKRIEEVILLKDIIKNGKTTFANVCRIVDDMFNYLPTEATMNSVLNYINRIFFNLAEKKKYGDFAYIEFNNKECIITSYFNNLLSNSIFKTYLLDSLDYAISAFSNFYDANQYRNGFQLYQKYSRKDVCRIMNWETDESSTMYGYRVKYDTCPIFVTYEKDEDINNSTKYEDEFLSYKEFSWMTRNNVKLDSREVEAIKNPVTRISLFVKKSNDEGRDFYYLGDMEPKTFQQTTIYNNAGKALPIVNIVFDMKDLLEEKMYKYFEG